MEIVNTLIRGAISHDFQSVVELEAVRLNSTYLMFMARENNLNLLCLNGSCIVIYHDAIQLKANGGKSNGWGTAMW